MTTKPAFMRRDWWYLGGLAAVTLASFWEAVVGRAAFFHQDLHGLTYPMKVYYLETLRAHHLPMWNPYIGAGYPQFAEGQIAALYPPNPLIFGLLPLPLAFNHMIIWHFILAGVFFYLFLRKRGLGGPAAFLGAAIFEWSGFATSHLQHPSITCSVAWLPLLLYFLEDGRQRAQAGRSLWRPILMGGGVVAVLGLAGYPPVLYYSLLTGAIYLLCAGIGWRRAALLWGGALIVGLSVSVVQWLPTMDLAHHSTRGVGSPLQFMTSFSLVPRQLPSLIFPHSFGSPAFGTYVGVQYCWEVCGYLGVLALPLAVWGAVRRRGRAWPFVVIGAVGLVLALGSGNPVYQILQHVPVINNMRAAGRYLLLWTVAGAALAAEGLEALLTPGRSRSWATVLAELGVVIAAYACVIAPLRCALAWPAYRGRPAILPSEWVFLAFGLLLFALVVIAARAGGFRPLLWTCLGAALLADLVAFAVPLAPLAPVGALYQPPWTVRLIAADRSWYRVWAWMTMAEEDPFFGEAWPWAKDFNWFIWDEKRLKPNLPTCWGMRAISTDATFMPKIRASVRGGAQARGNVRDARGLLPVASLLGAKYLVLRRPLAGLELLGTGDGLWLYRNPQALPRAWVVGAAQAVADPREEVGGSISADFPLREWAVLDAPPPVPLTTRREIPAKITFEDPRPEVMRMHTRTDAPGMLVVSETYDGDWQATLDGRRVRLYRADYIVRAVFLPAGEHTVEFRYRSFAYRLGLLVSLVMAALWTSLALHLWWRRRRSLVCS